MSFGVTFVLILVLLVGFGFSWGLLGLAWLVSINLITLMAYRYDKAIAGGRHTRIPEIILLGLAFCGGSPAACAAIYLFRKRHKAQKPDFMLPFWLIVTGQILTLCGLAIWQEWV